MDTIIISTVTPVYNGGKYLQDLVSALAEARAHMAAKYPSIQIAESIFVLDEPIDNSGEVLANLAEQYSWVSVITLSRNFGQHPATIAGVLHTSGDWVVTLDEDLQHKPKYILHLLKMVAEQHDDICYAKPESSTHKSIIKDFLARTFKKAMSWLLNNDNIQHFNSFRMIRGDIARAAAAICRHETYYDIALSWFTKRVNNTTLPLIDLRNIENVADSGYSFWGLVKHAKRMFMSSKVKLFRIGIPLGVIAFAISIVLSVYAFFSRYFQVETVLNKGWTSTILAVVFFGGLTTLLAGFILESISELLLSINGKPTFFTVDRSKDKHIKHALENYTVDGHS